MAILGHEDLVQAVTQSRIKFLDGDGSSQVKDSIGALSIDMTVGNLLHTARISDEPVNLSVEEGLDDETFLREMCEPVEIPAKGLVIEPGKIYLGRMPKPLHLSGDLEGRATTRSSYARLGLDYRVVGTDFYPAEESRTAQPLFALSTRGTKVVVKPHEPIPQLFVGTDFLPLPLLKVKELIESEDLIIKREQTQCSSDDLHFNGGVGLTMDAVIFVYQGTILHPGSKNPHSFKRVDLRKHKRGYYLPHGAFFLSSSVEEVLTSPKYITSVTEVPWVRTQATSWSYTPLPQFQAMPFLTHPNAPYHGHRNVSAGTITFENYVTDPDGVYLFPGARQAELFVYPLLSETTYTKPSRYHRQNGATKSRL